MSGETTETKRVTRSMSGTTKKTDSKLLCAKRASNKAKSGTTPGYSIASWTWKDEAYSIFMKEYKEKHYKPPPFPTGKLEKAPYIKRAEKVEAERVRAEKMADEMRAKGLL